MKRGQLAVWKRLLGQGSVTGGGEGGVGRLGEEEIEEEEEEE